MQVNRASVSSLRSPSRTDAAATVGAPVNGVAPIAGAENGLSDESPARPSPHFRQEEDDAPEGLIDAIDPTMVYRVASSVLRREGMIGLLLNRNA